MVEKQNSSLKLIVEIDRLKNIKPKQLSKYYYTQNSLPAYHPLRNHLKWISCASQANAIEECEAMLSNTEQSIQDLITKIQLAELELDTSFFFAKGEGLALLKQEKEDTDAMVVEIDDDKTGKVKVLLRHPAGEQTMLRTYCLQLILAEIDTGQRIMVWRLNESEQTFSHLSGFTGSLMANLRKTTYRQFKVICPSKILTFPPTSSSNSLAPNVSVPDKTPGTVASTTKGLSSLTISTSKHPSALFAASDHKSPKNEQNITYHPASPQGR